MLNSKLPESKETNYQETKKQIVKIPKSTEANDKRAKKQRNRKASGHIIYKQNGAEQRSKRLYENFVGSSGKTNSIYKQILKQ